MIRKRRYHFPNGEEGVADLHVHSLFSDGMLSPTEVVAQAVNVALSAVAVTDHDCVDGVGAAVQEANDEIEVVPGVELSTLYQNREVHIVGLFLNVENTALLEYLRKTRQERRDRIHEISHRLARLEIRIDPDEVLQIAGKGSAGRVHVARALVRNGHASTIPQAFREYIGDDAPAYVPRTAISSEDGIQLILQAEGLPIMAHPALTQADEIIPALVRMGLKGIEVFCPGQATIDFHHYLRVAQKHNLCISGGSDSHGFDADNDYIGRIRVPAECVEDMRELSKAT